MQELDYVDLELEFLRREYEWKFTAGKFVPTGDDLRAAIDAAKARLYDEVVGSTIEVGRLIIQKDEFDYNVYLYMGTEKDN